MEVVDQLINLSGIGADRVKLRWVSAAEGQLFANLVKELSEVMRAMGPFDVEQYKLPLAALDGALNSPRLRWLMGMERQLVEHENVYHFKVDEVNYKQLLKVATEEEYQKALILEVLKEGPLSVREISGKSGLPVYTVSILLSEVEKAGQVDLHGYEGKTPKFVSLAA
jgi:DNA-binding transcriptional ArsR family regulator